MGEFDDTLGRILGDPSAMAQIAKLAQSLGSPGGTSGNAPPMPPPVTENAPPVPPPGLSSQQTVPPPGTGGSDLSGLAGLSSLADSPMVRKLLPLLLEGRQNSEARRFLYALRPYLSPRRQENVERALQMARLLKVGRRFLSEGKG